MTPEQSPDKPDTPRIVRVPCEYCGQQRLAPSGRTCANCGAPYAGTMLVRPPAIVYEPDEMHR